eukprot:762589-Hanusia_phi.AAC.2
MRKRRMRARREHGQSLACLGGTWEMEMMRKQPVDATDERLCETTKPDNSLHINELYMYHPRILHSIVSSLDAKSLEKCN